MTNLPAKAGSTLLLTGGAGFLGKVILEQLIRQKDELRLDKVILLIRPDSKRSALQRFREKIVPSPCFRCLTPGWDRNLEVLSGDLTLPDWGLTQAQRLNIASRVTHIVHAAASVEFDLPLKEAAIANISTTLTTLEFAKSCQHLDNFIYVSTAYVRPYTAGPITEELVDLPFDPEQVYDDIMQGRANESQLLANTGHPNTYTLTKCIAEHLVSRKRGGLPLTIVRPSIISASIKSPFPGWIDSYAAFAAFVGVFGAGYLRVVAADPDARLDVVPVDMVAEIIVDECFRNSPSVDRLRIIHAAVGLANAMRIGDLPEFGTSYFRQYPSKRRAHLMYLGPLNVWRKLQHVVFERIPTKVAWLGAMATGQRSMAIQIKKLDNALAAIFKAFPYFTHHSFDFKMSSHSPETIDRNSYLRTICDGVRTYLIR